MLADEDAGQGCRAHLFEVSELKPANAVCVLRICGVWHHAAEFSLHYCWWRFGCRRSCLSMCMPCAT